MSKSYSRKDEIFKALLYAADEIASRTTPAIDLEDSNDITHIFIKKHWLIFEPISRELDMLPTHYEGLGAIIKEVADGNNNS